jgi:hypothetical protein
MKIWQISAFLFLFLSQGALAAPCDTFSSNNEKYKLCWNDEHKSWLNEVCSKKSCESQEFLKKKHKAPSIEKDLTGGRNSSALICPAMKLSLVILKDAQNNEQSFCQFSDKSLADANAVRRAMK